MPRQRLNDAALLDHSSLAAINQSLQFLLQSQEITYPQSDLGQLLRDLCINRRAGILPMVRKAQ
ncbi:hypothetical protein ppKF707_5285 [Metapseudomonas furukawaii]|nr:hypothetical protein ppKF707_5285 [Pseudomonas furukawaii]